MCTGKSSIFICIIYKCHHLQLCIYTHIAPLTLTLVYKMLYKITALPCKVLTCHQGQHGVQYLSQGHNPAISRQPAPVPKQRTPIDYRSEQTV